MIELIGIHKAFGSCKAVADVNIKVQRGTVHGIVGENGAGKSTAMNLLYGLIKPDGGEIRIDDAPVSFRSPLDAMARGIGMVHQHFMLSGVHSALDNVMLGVEPDHKFGRFLPKLIRPVDRNAARARLKELVQAFDFSLDLDCPVATLPVGAQQQVEILKLLYRNADILILDEPTAVLTPIETRALFLNLNRLKSEGKTILIVTHKLKEIMALTDHVSVFQQGRVVAERATAQTSTDELASLMVGRSIQYDIKRRPAANLGPVVCAMEGVLQDAGANPQISEASRLKGISLKIHSGEIVGIAGVEGNGQSALIDALRSPSSPNFRSAGEISFCGESVTGANTQSMRQRGLAIIPENRHDQGLLLDFPLYENLLLGHQRSPRFRRGPFLASGRINQLVKNAIKDFDIRPPNAALASGKFSGGNQQKIVVARECEGGPRLLIAAQPTRGVDIGATQFIHDRLVSLRDEGLAILLISSDLDEIMKLADRIFVMYEGHLVAELQPETTCEEDLGCLMGGSRPAAVRAARESGSAERRGHL